MTHVPIRMCVICRQRYSKELLTRYTIDKQEKLVGDMGGRGFYVCAQAACREKFSKYKPRTTK